MLRSLAAIFSLEALRPLLVWGMSTFVDAIADAGTMEDDPSSAADNAPEVGTDVCEALRGADAPGETMQVAEANPSSEGGTARAPHLEAPAVEAAITYKLRSSTAAEPDVGGQGDKRAERH